jgi:hypothetical protein
MTYLEQVKTLYDDYLRRSAELQRSRNPWREMFGMHGGAKDDPSHIQFIEAVCQTLSQPEKTAAEERAALVWLLFRAPEEHSGDRLAYWSLLAAQRAALGLIPLLSREEAAELSAWFTRTYPRGQRLPVQKELCAALEQRAR